MRERMKEERGAIAVLAALTIVILLAAVAFVIDISRLYHERQVLQNAVDFGSLAGAQDLPVQGSALALVANADATKVATANAPQITAANLTITYQCIVGDQDGDGVPDAGTVPFVCGPTGTWSSGWTKKGATRVVHDCNPFAGDKCNTIRLADQQHHPLLLRAGDRDQYRHDRYGECGVMQGLVRCCRTTPRRRHGARPNGQHGRRRRRERQERGSVGLGLLRPIAAMDRGRVAPVRQGFAGQPRYHGQVRGLRRQSDGRARQPEPTAHLSGLSDRDGFEPLVGHQWLESGLQECRGGHQPGVQPGAGDQLPRRGRPPPSKPPRKEVRRPGITRTSAIRSTPLARCSPPRAGPPSPMSSSS